jgi:transcriptional regulator with XRE-family HTH domain
MGINYDAGNVPRIELRHRLRIAREFAGLEQEQLAALIGVARNTVGSAESGKRAPRRITVNAWALVCGVPRSWLTDGVAPPSGAGEPSQSDDWCVLGNAA